MFRRHLIRARDDKMWRSTGSTLGPLLFLIYLNDLPNSSDILKFRIFADDTNIFLSDKSINSLEQNVNIELEKVKEWCDINKLSINTSKTNFMIIKSAKKNDALKNIKMKRKDGFHNSLESKTHIKYLGVILDEKVTWKQHVVYVSTTILRTTGIICKLRHYLSIKQLKLLL